MNPFIDTVANNAIRNLQEESARAQQTARAQAVSRGAFGGARQGIQEATLQAETAAAHPCSGRLHCCINLILSHPISSNLILSHPIRCFISYSSS